MKRKRIKLSFSIFFIMLITVFSFWGIQQHTVSQSLSSNLILENAMALASECESGKVMGSEFTVTCGTPTGANGGKCSYSVVTCQGSAGCCTRDYCPSHM